MIDILNKSIEMIQNHQPFVEITVIEARGSAPSQVGAKALVTRNGIVAGTVGGGKVEARAIEYSKKLLNKDSDTPVFVTWNLQKDIGMTCGGEMRLYFHLYDTRTWNIAIFGAGHVAQALVPLLCTLNCHVYCIDPRPEWLDKISEHPRLTKIKSDNPSSVILEIPEDCFFITMTQGHATDVPILKQILTVRNPVYVGAIGSHSKSLVLKKDLLAAGFGAETLNQIHCPIGLSFGDNSPAEIAISVAAQLITVRDQAALLFRDKNKDEMRNKTMLIQPEIENRNSGPR